MGKPLGERVFDVLWLTGIVAIAVAMILGSGGVRLLVIVAVMAVIAMLLPRKRPN